MASLQLARASHSEIPAHSSSSFITTYGPGSSSLRFATVEGSSLEEKLSFLAEQRERELNRCDAFAREVEEAMEKAINARLGENRSSCGYHSAVSCPASIPPPNQPCSGVMPGPSHLRHVSAGITPELRPRQQTSSLEMNSLGVAERHTRSMSSMPASPAWLADLSYYESASPAPASVPRSHSSRHTRKAASNTSRTVRGRTAGRMTGEDSSEMRMTVRQPSRRRAHSM